MPISLFEKTHLLELKLCANQEPGQWIGGRIRPWAEYLVTTGGAVIAGLDVNALPDAAVNRAAIQEMIADSARISVENCAVTVLAWGGMHRQHAQRAFQSWERWKPILVDLRSAEISSDQAYQKFYDLRQRKVLSGMSVAYYTKLVYFFGGGARYIMDQWTARSVNLLTGRSVVALKEIPAWRNRRTSFQVADNNSVSIYKEYCKLVEALSLLVGYGDNHGRTEELLMSEGRGRGRWRNYVIDNT